MLVKLINQIRLTWRLIWDKRVNLFLKLFFIGLPLLYLAVPAPDDVLPLVGLLDDLAFLILGAVIFVSLCPGAMVTTHRDAIEGRNAEAARVEAYRHPQEIRDLAIGSMIVIVPMILGGYLVGLIGLGFLALAYFSAMISRGYMLGNAVEATVGQFPEIHAALQKAQANLPEVPVKLIVTQQPMMNAYTFGFDAPYTIVLTSGLAKNLSAEELQSVIGHELGHILLGHVRLNSLLTGTVGLLFYKWSRSCEYSADAVALQACDGNPRPFISALIKISSGLVDRTVNVEQFLEQDQSGSSLDKSGELVSTHPYINNRIRRVVELSRQAGASGARTAFALS